MENNDNDKQLPYEVLKELQTQKQLGILELRVHELECALQRTKKEDTRPWAETDNWAVNFGLTMEQGMELVKVLKFWQFNNDPMQTIKKIAEAPLQDRERYFLLFMVGKCCHECSR